MSTFDGEDAMSKSKKRKETLSSVDPLETSRRKRHATQIISNKDAEKAEEKEFENELSKIRLEDIIMVKADDSLDQIDKNIVAVDDDDVASLDGSLTSNIISIWTEYLRRTIATEVDCIANCDNVRFVIGGLETLGNSERNVTLANTITHLGVETFSTVDVNVCKRFFIPYSLKGDEHWSLIVVCNLNNVRTIINGDKEVATGERPFMFQMDSYHYSGRLPYQHDDRVPAVILLLLWIQMKQQYPDEPISLRKFTEVFFLDKQERICIDVVVPQQKNTIDCGLYIFKFIEAVINDPPVRSSVMLQYKDIPDLNIDRFRGLIKKVIYDKVFNA